MHWPFYCITVVVCHRKNQRRRNWTQVELWFPVIWKDKYFRSGTAMAPGGSVFKEVLESHLLSSDYETGKAKFEAKSNSTFTKSSVGLNGKNGISSKNGVHDLLGCPVCKNLMYPPIHQVQCLQFLSFFSFGVCVLEKHHDCTHEIDRDMGTQIVTLQSFFFIVHIGWLYLKIISLVYLFLHCNGFTMQLNDNTY